MNLHYLTNRIVNVFREIKLNQMRLLGEYVKFGKAIQQLTCLWAYCNHIFGLEFMLTDWIKSMYVSLYRLWKENIGQKWIILIAIDVCVFHCRPSNLKVISRMKPAWRQKTNIRRDTRVFWHVSMLSLMKQRVWGFIDQTTSLGFQ